MQIKAAHILYSPNHDPSNQASLPPDDPAWATAKAAAQKTADELNAITDVTQREARFAEIAKAESDDNTSGAAGGELGTFTKDQMVAAFADPLFSNANLKPGDIVGPVQSQFGYHVILFEERIPSSTDRVGEVKAALAAPGADFAAIAKQYSDGDEALQGGELGWQVGAQLPAEVLAEVQKTAAGATTGSIQASDAFYFEKVEDHQQLAPEGAARGAAGGDGVPDLVQHPEGRCHQERHDPDEQGHLQRRGSEPDSVIAPVRRGVCVWFTGSRDPARAPPQNILIELLAAARAARSPCWTATSCGRTSRPGSASRARIVTPTCAASASWPVRSSATAGSVVAAVVSPYRQTRDEVREMVGRDSFLEVFVDTPLDVCEARDVKGWYAKARSGEITGLTGVDDPYEPPLHPELTLHTTDTTPEANAAARPGRAAPARVRRSGVGFGACPARRSWNPPRLDPGPSLRPSPCCWTGTVSRSPTVFRS